jgi:hypothetical protein
VLEDDPGKLEARHMLREQERDDKMLSGGDLPGGDIGGV